MAEFRIDQPGGAGVGVAGESRVDLLPGFVIELHATPVAGAVFTWEILDKVNAPAAALTATTGLTVNIGSVGGDIPAFCGFMVRLTQNLLGVITIQDRIVAVRSAAAQIRPPLFGEQAPSTQTLNANNPDLSTDNAVYPDLAGLGVPGNNPFGWREWAWEIAKALETTAAVAGTPAPLRMAGASRQIVGVLGSEVIIGNFGAFDPTVYATPTILLEATYIFVPATAGSIELRLYDMGTRLVPGPGALRATIQTTFADAGIQKCVSAALTPSATPGINTGDIQDAERIYELRVELIGANPGDALEIGAVNLVVAPGIAGGGMAAPNSPSFLTLGAAAGLLAERVFTPQNSVVGTDNGPGNTYVVELDGDVLAPGPNKGYGTDALGTKGWYTQASSPVLWEWNGIDTTQFAADNVLPAPGYSAGVVAGASLTAVASVEVPGGNVLRLSAASASVGGYAVWWIDLPIALQALRVELELTPPVATLGPADSIVAGFCYAGDLTGYFISDGLLLSNPGPSFTRIVSQVDPGGATLLMLDTLTQGGYVYSLESKIRADRGNAGGFPPSGVPRVYAESTALAFAPPPTSSTSPQGLVYVTNSVIFPPAPGWGGSTCNRVGVFISAGPAGFAAPNDVDITKLRILKG